MLTRHAKVLIALCYTDTKSLDTSRKQSFRDLHSRLGFLFIEFNNTDFHICPHILRILSALDHIL